MLDHRFARATSLTQHDSLCQWQFEPRRILIPKLVSAPSADTRREAEVAAGIPRGNRNATFKPLFQHHRVDDDYRFPAMFLPLLFLPIWYLVTGFLVPRSQRDKDKRGRSAFIVRGLLAPIC